MQKEAIKDVTGICFETLCRTLLSVLLMVIMTGMGFGVTRSAVDLLAVAKQLFAGDGLHEALKGLIINVLMILAILELFRTVMAYFTEGRVKVTYIIDTALVVVITEIMGFWYKDVETKQLLLAVSLVIALMGVRIMAIRFSPKRRDLLDGF